MISGSAALTVSCVVTGETASSTKDSTTRILEPGVWTDEIVKIPLLLTVPLISIVRPATRKGNWLVEEVIVPEAASNSRLPRVVLLSCS